jgi:Bifunctional DNA primase/polymerase, N-terminal
MTARKPIFALYAARYAAKGLAVFPLAPNSKKPLKDSHGFKDATTDPRQIAEWSRETPFSNLGLATGAISGISLIDLDPKNGGFETERAFRAEGKFWPDTPVALTRSGGRHIYLAYHPALITGTNRLGPGIDIRNDGGFAVLPPSVIDGRKYELMHRPEAGLAPVPQWVLRGPLSFLV